MAEINNLKEFRLWIKKISSETVPKQLLGTFQKLVTIDLFRRVVLKSPVGNPDYWLDPESAPPGYVGGRFRANWQITVGESAAGEIDSTDFPVPNIPGNLTGFQTVWITNNVPYADALEGGWSRRQAPDGIVEVAIVEMGAAKNGPVPNIKFQTEARRR